MNIFNSLGSNYNLQYVRRSLFKKNQGTSQKLKLFLEKKYGGNVTLTYKGRQAIELALETLALKENEGVAVTGFTCIAVVEAIQNQNLTPVFLDINPHTLNFSSETLEEKVKKDNVKAVIIQNTLGYPCDIDEILSVCKKHNLILIEDLAHSIGTVYSNGKEAGTIGDLVVLSFSQDKVVDAVSGGALIVHSSKFIVHSKKDSEEKVGRDKLYPLFTWCIRKSYPVGIGKVLHFVFQNLKLLSDPMKNSGALSMSDWHAGIVMSEFKKIEENLNHRQTIAHIYADNLDTKNLSSYISDVIDKSTCLRFPFFVENRDKLVSYLKKSGVYVSDIWYDGVVAPKKYLGLAKYPKSSCPNAEGIAKKILNLPTHINVSEKDAIKICRLINSF